MTKQRYWKGIEELTNEPKVDTNEFQEDLPNLSGLANEAIEQSSASRRGFLKMFGFSVTAATVAASCEMPVRKSIPYLIKPDEITPGVANYYATTYADGGDYCSILVKTREGRPIKIEGNKLSPISKGGTSAVVQASILSLYDNYRPQAPKSNGESTTWESVDKDIITKLENIQANGGKIGIVSSTILSPSTKQAIKDFIAKYPSAEHATYDAVSYSAMLRANEITFGLKVIPGYRFDKADLIVSVGADFLGTWLSPVEFAGQYGSSRKISKKNPSMSRHIQVESHMSMTGSNADKRIMVKPSQTGSALVHLYNVLASKTGAATTANPNLESKAKSDLAKTADELLNAKGKSLVVCGLNDVNAQLMTNAINNLLGNYGTTIDMDNYSYQRQGDEEAVTTMLKGFGANDAIIFFDANPVYNFADASIAKNCLSKVGLSISLNEKADETSKLCAFVCPNHHYLESWNDAEPKRGSYSITQPVIAPLFNTRSAAESLLTWSGNTTPYLDYIQSYWQENLFGSQSKYGAFNIMWDHAVHDGVFSANSESGEVAFSDIDVAAVGNALTKSGNAKGIEVVLYEKVGIRDGKHGDNPWLQELPDPISKMTWDNYAAVSKNYAEKLGLSIALGRQAKSVGTDTEVISVTVNGKEVKLPVNIQPGTPDDTVAIAVGYGRETGGKAGVNVGTNVFAFQTSETTNLNYATGATVVATNEIAEIAATQHHHSVNDGLFERRIVKETTLKEYKKNPFAGNEDRAEVVDKLTTLYPGHNDRLDNGHHWEMAVDLGSCIGCGSCVISCTAENNVPVVGKDEVRRSREMHWMRIDRYYAGEENNPSVIFQPLMCQHCDNAPCENVCPTSATNHSSEGLNQMAYNRCFGTRYCANNCPYKVRRFNWFDYLGADSFVKGTIFENEHDAHEMSEDLTRMVLNPDVTIRSRGVMEKCSFCVQRLQGGKLAAKKENRRLADSDVVTACQDACPTNAISFGDINDKDSEVYQWANDERGFKVIEEVHTLPSVTYLTKVRNKAKSEV